MKIRSFFGDLKSANETVAKLKDAGFANAYVDINDHYIGSKNVQINPAGSSSGDSLANLVLNSGQDNLDKEISPLAAANPMVSGMADFEEITDINYSVFVEAQDMNLQEVKDIVESMEGTLEDPNVSRNKAIADSDIVIEKAIDEIKDMD